jgi:hypothetical protein
MARPLLPWHSFPSQADAADLAAVRLPGWPTAVLPLLPSSSSPLVVATVAVDVAVAGAGAGAVVVVAMEAAVVVVVLVRPMTARAGVGVGVGGATVVKAGP